MSWSRPVALRVAELTATVGGPASGPLLSYTDTIRVVAIDLDVAKQQFVQPGHRRHRHAAGRVHGGRHRGRGRARWPPPAGGGNGAPTSTTIDVTVTVADQQALGTLDAAPVTVSLEADRAENVLTVPVAALVALAEGGYGVQVVEGSGVRYVAVTTGMFAGGRVEISGDGHRRGHRGRDAVMTDAVVALEGVTKVVPGRRSRRCATSR